MTEQTLDTIVAALEQTAAELRAGDLSASRAAGLVDDVARLAANAGAELDLRVRAGDQPLAVAGQLAFGA